MILPLPLLLGGGLLWGQDARIFEGGTVEVRASRRMNSLEEDLENHGVRFVRRGAEAGEPVFRGETRRLLTRLDGARIQGACTDHMDPAASYAEAGDLDEIQLASGASKPVGSASASLNLPLRRPKVQGVSGTTQLELSSARRGALWAGTLDVNGAEWGLASSGQLSGAGNYRRPDGGLQPYSQYTKAHGAVRLEHRGTGTISVRGLWDENRDVGFASLPMDASLARTGQLVVGYDRQAGNLTWNSQVWSNFVRHEMDDTQRDSVFMHMDMPGWSNTMGAWTELHRDLGALAATIRSEAWMVRQSAEMTMYPDSGALMFLYTWPTTRTTAGQIMSALEGPALAGQWRIHGTLEGRRLNLENDLGRRQAQILEADGASRRRFLLGGAGAGWTSTIGGDSLWLGASWQQRAPEVEELWGYWLYRARDNLDQRGTPSLSSEDIWQVEWGVQSRLPWGKWGTTLWGQAVDRSLEPRTDRQILPMTPGAQEVVVWGNRGWQKRMGADAHAFLRYGSLRGSSNVSAMVGWTSEGLPQAQLPAVGGQNSLQWVGQDWGGQLDVEWSLPAYRAARWDHEPRTSGYVIPSLGGHVSFGEGWKVELELENPLDQTWRSHLDWGTSPRPGRGIRMLVRWSPGPLSF